jgi:cell division protein DivIC
MKRWITPVLILWKRIPALLRTKYFLSGFVFFVWICFFDKHNFITQYKLSRTINHLKSEKSTYIQKIEEAKQQKVYLENNLEKIAREKYFMKKPNEEVFIIQRERK